MSGDRKPAKKGGDEGYRRCRDAVDPKPTMLSGGKHRNRVSTALNVSVRSRLPSTESCRLWLCLEITARIEFLVDATQEQIRRGVTKAARTRSGSIGGINGWGRNGRSQGSPIPAIPWRVQEFHPSAKCKSLEPTSYSLLHVPVVSFNLVAGPHHIINSSSSRFPSTLHSTLPLTPFDIDFSS